MNNSIIATLIQEIGPILISVIMAWLAWLARRYLRSLGDEKKLATIAQVANTAIDYAEDLDKRGDLEKILTRLDLSPEVINHTSKGIQKLHVAGQWVEEELKRLGIDITEEEAQKWVAAEFQKRIAGLNLTSEQLEKLQSLLLLLQTLDQDKLQAFVANVRPPAPQRHKPLPQDDLTVVEPESSTELPATTPPPAPTAPEAGIEPSLENELAGLAWQAVKYVETLKIDRQLTVPEIDIATAWMLTEVTKQGLHVTPEQIAREIHLAFGD